MSLISIELAIRLFSLTDPSAKIKVIDESGKYQGETTATVAFALVQGGGVLVGGTKYKVKYVRYAVAHSYPSRAEPVCPIKSPRQIWDETMESWHQKRGILSPSPSWLGSMGYELKFGMGERS